MSTLLWNITCNLEYPDLVALREIRGTQGVGPNKAYVQVPFQDSKWPHIARLERHGLIVRQRQGGFEVMVTAWADRLLEFALDEEGSERPR